MTEQSQALFLFGPGYSGHALARLWQGQIFGTARSADKAAALEAAGIVPVNVADDKAMHQALGGAHLVVSAPPLETGCPALAALGGIADRAASVAYLSTTGVYGDRGGGWVFEWSAPAPSSVRGQRRLEAEQGWKAVRPDVSLVRLPGIYGPGRSVFERLKSGRARRIIKPGQVFSRIHVADLAAGVNAILTRQASGVFHLCDDLAAPPQDVTAYGAQLLGLPVPPPADFASAELSDMARSFYSECKRVSNARAKAALGWRPAYPTYQDGLNRILETLA